MPAHREVNKKGGNSKIKNEKPKLKNKNLITE
jgi:hypothetical protein